VEHGDDDAVFTLTFGSGGTAQAARIRAEADLPYALQALGLTGPRRVIVVVGGAGGMADDALTPLLAVLADALLPVIVAGDAVVLDGGTDSGVMRMLGRLREASPTAFPLVGVAAEGTVAVPGRPGRPDAAALDPHHSHFLLVPGDRWGDDAPWLARAATVVAGTSRSVTLLINGGEITFDDAAASLAENRPVVVLAGTGRTADRIAAASHGDHGDGVDARAAAIADSPRVSIVPVSDPGAVRAALENLLGLSG
jgi:hypothetical protein